MELVDLIEKIRVKIQDPQFLTKIAAIEEAFRFESQSRFPIAFCLPIADELGVLKAETDRASTHATSESEEVKIVDHRASAEVLTKRESLMRIIRPILVDIQDPYEGGGDSEVDDALTRILDAICEFEDMPLVRKAE